MRLKTLDCVITIEIYQIQWIKKKKKDLKWIEKFPN